LVAPSAHAQIDHPTSRCGCPASVLAFGVEGRQRLFFT
jgi:hypothetical protein